MNLALTTKAKVILVIFISLILFNQTRIINSSFIDNQTEMDLGHHSWKITNWSDYPLAFFYPVGYIQAQNGSVVWYNVTDFHNQNYTHSSFGFFSIGNLTTDTNNNEIGSNLALSIYPWISGLITHNNWTWHKTESKKATEEGFSEGKIEENVSFLFNEFKRNSIRFDYQQNLSLGNQNTTLIYDMDTGVLLYGFTELFYDNYYVLELELSTSSLISSSNYISSVNFSNYFIMAFFGLTGLQLYFKKSRKLR